MSSYDCDIGIVGVGAAGFTVAAGAAQFDARTVLIEKRHQLGGDCLHFGCAPSTALLRSAAVWTQARRARGSGLPLLMLPLVDLAAVMWIDKGVPERRMAGVRSEWMSFGVAPARGWPSARGSTFL